MAKFELIDDGIYKVEGELTQEDVDRINSFQIRTCLVLQNTKGQSSEIIKQIKTDNVYFSIIGGLDYNNKRKFNNSEYIERTYSAPKGLTKILEYFEKIESGMKPEWTDTQKCMYAYNALAVDTDYVKELDEGIIANGVTPRSLNGILYNQLTCAGMALTFKEMMDRLGIPCHYQNQKYVHSFNVVELDGQYRGIDVTWDCTRGNERECSFRNFGRDVDFYKKHGHQIANDSEETLFDLTTFTDEEIQQNYGAIQSALKERKKIVYPFRKFDTDRKKKFLPVDRFMEGLEDEKSAITKLRLLKEFGTMPEGMEELLNATRTRYGFIADYIGKTGTRNIMHEISQNSNLDGELMWKNSHVVLSNNKSLTEEQIQNMSSSLVDDIKEYYKQYFLGEAPQIDSLLGSYTMVENMPAELTSKTATLRANLYSKIKLFADGNKFFEQLGIPQEEIELASGKAKTYLESKKKMEDNPNKKHESDIDFLGAILPPEEIKERISNGTLNIEDMAMAIKEAREQFPEISDDDFKVLLNEALGNIINIDEAIDKIGEIERYLQHEKDLDFLGAVLENDVIDIVMSGRDYTEEDLQKLMKEVRTDPFWGATCCSLKRTA